MLVPARSQAARPLLDQHQWDSYFALFAQDASVPWKSTTVRLDTYSGAPVDFAAYAVDPAEVIVAGASRGAHAIDTSRLRPVVRWRFSPPQGYRFETSDVSVPLGSSEGFFVVEARRGDAIQQVWLNRTRLGLLTKESPEGLALWTVDLRTGRALRGTRIELLVGRSLVSKTTDASGLMLWRDRDRPAFALAESGSSRAFVSLLPQAPVPSLVVGVRVESAVVRAGERARVVGFARRRVNGVYRKSGGDARITLVGHGRTVAAATERLDDAGAFSVDLPIPAGTEAGDYALLANAGGAVGGTTLHVDASADLTLSATAACPCAPNASVPIDVVATRGIAPAIAPAGGVTVDVAIVRTPHVLPPGESDQTPRWGTAVVVKQRVTTDSSGRARVSIDPPSDGLASTYGVRASTEGDGATAVTRVTVPTSAVSLAVEPDAPAVDLGQAAGFTVLGFGSTDGAPSSGLNVDVKLSHGANVTDQSVRLDATGRARVVFKSPSVGTNLAVATAASGGQVATDAASVVVAPGTVSGRSGASGGDLSLTLDHSTYRPGDHVAVSASLPGAVGQALITVEGARTYQARVVPVSGGRASATLDLGDPQGDARIAVALVRDGAVVQTAVPVQVDGPGHARTATLSLDRPSYAAGDVAKVAVRGIDAHGSATVVLRLTDGRPTGGADLDDIAAVLRAGGTTSQNPSAESPAWHGWVAPARSKAGDIFSADRPRQVRSAQLAIGSAAPRPALWRVERGQAQEYDVALPHEKGHYVLSLVEIFDDGGVAVGQASVTVA